MATDGRYFSQAAKQLDQSWTLLKQGLQDVPTWQEWAVEQARENKTVGVDPSLLTAGVAKKLDESIVNGGGKGLEAVEDNLVDLVWGAERPARPVGEVILLEDKYAGKSVKNKLDDLRKELEKKKSSGFVVSMLDEVAWLFNLRGSDIPYNPVFFSYATVTPTAATLYIDSSKLSAGALNHLKENSIAVQPYDTIFADAQALGRSIYPQASTDGPAQPVRKFLVSNRTSWALKRALGGEATVEEVRSPIGDAKAVKNETELEGMRTCHVRDGAALIEYFAWLENELIANKATIDEVEAADKLEQIRSKHQHFVGLSFDTISSTGANAAIIHYKPKRGACSVIDPSKIYLCDSGAQFYDGTTDTTRTLHFGTPTEMERKAYTLVLKGHIALDQAVFPKGTTGFALDSLARQPLWVR